MSTFFFRKCRAAHFGVVLGLLGVVGVQLARAAALNQSSDTVEASPQARGGRGGEGPRVYKNRVTAHWFQNNTRFWYRNDLRAGAKEFILVDAEKGTRTPAFDHAKLASSLSKAAGQEYQADHLPFDNIEFLSNGSAIQFDTTNKVWKCDLSSYECTLAAKPAAVFRNPATEQQIALRRDTVEAYSSPEADETELPSPQAGGRQGGRGGGGGFDPSRSQTSPDKKWTAFIKEHNVYVRSEADQKEFQLSQDGVTNNSYGRLEWTTDSKSLVGWRIEPGDRKEVYRIQSSPPNGGRAVLQTGQYALPGDKFTTYELSVFDPENKKQIKPEVDRFDFGNLNLRWNRDGYHFTYQKVDRGHQRFRVIEVDAHTGAIRNLIDEKSATFIWTVHLDGMPNITLVNWLPRTDEIIHVSEQDGWRHLYLIDAKEGKVKNQITKGEWVVRGVDYIDEQNRQVWFMASGRNADEDPYFLHYYRINFDGTGLVALTEGNGTHSVTNSPDYKYVIDTSSRVDLPPVNNLRRASDGQLICKLEEADISELSATGWKPPEVFAAKGRDGKTDIWGIIDRPRNLDPNKKYPIIEDIYAGPQGSGPGGFVPKAFSGASQYTNYTSLGFVLVKVDGMGLPGRSKAFHDVCWQNLKDAGFPDRIPWIKAAAAKYPYMDITRVGVFGTSAGGQNAAGAVLFYPEFYKVAVANCGCHDNRMDKSSWNEQWMGYPVGPQYSESSNIDHADQLQGKLFLIVGELDTNVPPESTYRFADALIKARKDFDFLVVPGADHGIRAPRGGGPAGAVFPAGQYAQRRMRDFFVRHLLGVEPPDRNASSSRGNN